MCWASFVNCDCEWIEVPTRANHTCPVRECEGVLANVSVHNLSWNLRAVGATDSESGIMACGAVCLCVCACVCACTHTHLSVCVCVCVTGGREWRIKASASLWQFYLHHHLPLSDASISQLPTALWKLSIRPVLLATHLIPGCRCMSDHIFNP